jgi:penicillin-binding protein 1C
MEYLHNGNGSDSPKTPRGIIAQELHFSPPIESPRREWFIDGTEISEVKMVAQNSAGQQLQAKILYPTNGTVIAMDPDIPTKHQLVQFSSRGGDKISWIVDGETVGNGTEVEWAPSGGRHKLVLKDLQGVELDSVNFEVRGEI